MTSKSHRPNLKVVHGDITQRHVDAVVNAANSSLLGALALTFSPPAACSTG